MKKIVLFLLAFAMIFSLIACSDKSEEEDSIETSLESVFEMSGTEKSSESVSEIPETETEKPLESVLEKASENETEVTVGLTYDAGYRFIMPEEVSIAYDGTVFSVGDVTHADMGGTCLDMSIGDLAIEYTTREGETISFTMLADNELSSVYEPTEEVFYREMVIEHACVRLNTETNTLQFLSIYAEPTYYQNESRIATQATINGISVWMLPDLEKIIGRPVYVSEDGSYYWEFNDGYLVTNTHGRTSPRRSPSEVRIVSKEYDMDAQKWGYFLNGSGFNAERDPATEAHNVLGEDAVRSMDEINALLAEQ